MAKIKIVCIDDEKYYLKSIQRTLSIVHYDVHPFTRIDEALEFINLNGCDVLILDYQMPFMKGTTVVNIIREEHPHIPIIMLTGAHYLETAFQSIGINDVFMYLTKPHRSSQLISAVTKAVEHCQLCLKIDKVSLPKRILTDSAYLDFSKIDG